MGWSLAWSPAQHSTAVCTGQFTRSPPAPQGLPVAASPPGRRSAPRPNSAVVASPVLPGCTGCSGPVAPPFEYHAILSPGFNRSNCPQVQNLAVGLRGLGLNRSGPAGAPDALTLFDVHGRVQPSQFRLRRGYRMGTSSRHPGPGRRDRPLRVLVVGRLVFPFFHVTLAYVRGCRTGWDWPTRPRPPGHMGTGLLPGGFPSGIPTVGLEVKKKIAKSIPSRL